MKTVFETLNDRVSSASAELTFQENRLRSLQNDPSIIKFRAIFAKIGEGNFDSWVHEDGTAWEGMDAQAMNNFARNAINENVKGIEDAQDKILDLQKELNINKKELTAYTAPKKMETEKHGIPIWVWVLVVVVILGIVIYNYKRKKTK